MRMMIADELRNAGYTVLEASSADEAHEVLRHTPKVGLVFTDLRMPEALVQHPPRPILTYVFGYLATNSAGLLRCPVGHA